MKQALRLFFARLMVGLSVLAFVPLSAHADTQARMFVDCYTPAYMGKLFPGATGQTMLVIAIGNMGNNNLRVSNIGVEYTGSATSPADILSATFRFTNVNGNVVTAGTANFDPVTRTATLSGSPLFVVPTGYAYDVTVEIAVAPGATLGNTAEFGIKINDFNYLTNNPPSIVDGRFPCSGGIMYIMPAPPSTSPSFAIVQPNGGEILKKGVRYPVKWAAKNLPTGSYFCKVDLFRAGNLIKNIRTMSAGYLVMGITWAPESDIVAASNYRIRAYVCNAAGNVIMQDTSDANFRIQN